MISSNYHYSPIRLALLTLLAVVVFAMPSHAHHVLISLTRAPAFSGDLKGCADQPNNTACIWGLPAALAKHRLLVNTTNSTSNLFLPKIDIMSAFVNIHPKKAVVNIELYKSLNISYYTSDPWLLTDLGVGTPLKPFMTDVVSPLMTLRDVSETHRLRPFIHRYLLLHGGRIAILDVGNSRSSFVTNLLPRLRLTIEYLRRIHVEIIVLLCDDILQTADWYVINLGDAYAVDVAVDLRATVDTPCTPTTIAIHNTTKGIICRDSSSSSMMLASLMLHTHTTNSSTQLAAAIFIDSYTSTLQANDESDAQYLQQRDLIREELRIAVNEDAIVGSTSVGIPAARTTDPTTNEYPCFTGECALGTLLLRTYLYNNLEADIAIVSAGSFLGYAWPPGNITSSQVWDAYPYVNAYCVGRMTGLKLFQLIDATLSISTFIPDGTGDRLLHLGNAIIEINPNLPTHRLISLKIRNNITGVYEPLDRLRYYNFVTNDYLCVVNTVTANLFNALLSGESIGVREGVLAQNGVKAYLMAHSPYNDLTTGYMRFVDSTAPIVWSTDEVACGRTEYWDSGVKSCVPCAGGQRGMGRTCVAEERMPNKFDLIWQIGTPVLAVVLICVAVVCILEWRRRSGARVTTNAPRGGSDVVIVFTDIQASTKLWGTSPASMAAALGKHNAVIRKEIARHNGYEVKTVGDSFMIALSSAQDAVDMAAAIQTALHRQSWPRAIDNVYNATTDELLAAVEDDVDGEWIPELPLPSGDNNNNSGADSSQPAAAFRGIRIRIGAHYGPVEVEFDTVAKGYDYHGPTVNVAARVEAAGRGGQILVTNDLAHALPSTSKTFTTWTIVPHGAVELRGVGGTTELSEVRIAYFHGRVFACKLPVCADITFDQVSATLRSFASLSASGQSEGTCVPPHNPCFNGSMLEGSSEEEPATSPEQDLAFKCLDVYMSVVPRLDRELMLRMLGRAWGLEGQDSLSGKDRLQLLAIRAGHRLRRVMDQTHKTRDSEKNALSVNLHGAGSVSEILGPQLLKAVHLSSTSTHLVRGQNNVGLRGTSTHSNSLSQRSGLGVVVVSQEGAAADSRCNNPATCDWDTFENRTLQQRGGAFSPNASVTGSSTRSMSGSRAKYSVDPNHL